MNDGPILVTGAAGFIGFHVAQCLLKAGLHVVGVDNISPYYDPKLKRARADLLSQSANFHLVKLDLAHRRSTAKLFDEYRFPYVVHLAAQAGVRHSLSDPHAYIDANLQGFVNVLEGCRHTGCMHLLYASSSSVYGANTRLPFSVHDGADHPLSLYGATKRANELMAHTYSHNFALPTTGLRFFTVYGPWGRPDMAMWLFSSAIIERRPIKLFNHGDMVRDFTYVDDVVEAIKRLIEHIPAPNPDLIAKPLDPAMSTAPWRIFNVGNNNPAKVPFVVELLEKELGRTTEKELLPMQPGDVQATYADIDDLKREVGFQPSTPLEEGIKRFVSWFRTYHGV